MKFSIKLKCGIHFLISFIFFFNTLAFDFSTSHHLKASLLCMASLTINSSTGPWLALANSVSEFIGCLGCRMLAKASQGRLGILGKHILMAVLGNLGRWPRICWHSRQMVLGNLDRWPRICWHSRQMVLGFLAYGPGFLGKWPRICPLQLHSPHMST